MKSALFVLVLLSACVRVDEAAEERLMIAGALESLATSQLGALQEAEAAHVLLRVNAWRSRYTGAPGARIMDRTAAELHALANRDTADLLARRPPPMWAERRARELRAVR